LYNHTWLDILEATIKDGKLAESPSL